MGEKEQLDEVRAAARRDRKLLERAAQALAEIDRGQGLSDEHADVLAALRVRIEGKERASLEELLTTAGGMSRARDLGDAAQQPDESRDWPVIEEKKREWPGL